MGSGPVFVSVSEGMSQRPIDYFGEVNAREVGS